MTLCNVDFIYSGIKAKKTRNVRTAFILFFLSVLLVKVSIATPHFTIKTIVIDAGHGGKDPGAIGLNKTQEKDVALAVALNLGKKVKEAFPEVKIVYTRSTDVFIPLVERANIANKNKADLFISIHCNSSTNRTATGSSTYVLGLHKSEDNLEVAKRENAVIELEDDVDKNYDFNPNSPEGHIIMSMKQNAFLDQSIDIAARIETKLTGMHKSRGVKQAGFFVLYKTSMPSLLAEIGFISNPTEEKYLASSKGQEEIADGIFNAFTDYKNTIEKGTKVATNTTATKTSSNQEADNSIIANTNTPPKKATTNDDETPITAQPTAAKTARQETAAASTQPAATSATKPSNNNSNQQASTASTKKEVPATAASVQSEYAFYLQLLASAKPLSAYPKLQPLFGNIEVETLPNGIHRFMAGKFNSYEEAEKLQSKAAANGFPDAFVIAYKNGKRLDVNATKALKK